MADSGATQFTFHLESTTGPEECIRKIKEAGMKVDILKNTKTSIISNNYF